MIQYSDRKTSLSDTPFDSSINDFGTERYVNGLIRFIERSSAPLTIALQGEWGSGKTSLMNKLQVNLCGEGKPFIGVSINTWEFSMLATPEMAVISILEYLIQTLSGQDSETKKIMSGLVKGFMKGMLGGLHEYAKANTFGLSSAITAPIVSGISENEEKKVSLSDLRAALTKAIKKSLVNGKRGILVFVDDLDRLNPSLAVEILELLKNVFTLEHCIFILAIDYEVVVKGLKPKFGELTEKNEREFRSFFDKLIQVPFSLPVSSYKPDMFVLNSLAKIGYLSPSDIDENNIRLIDPIKKIVEKSVGKNPRSIKRLINTLSLLNCISASGSDEYESFIESDAGKIANMAIVAIQVCYPKIYRMLAISPDFLHWNEEVAARLNIEIKEEDDNNDWKTVLKLVCATDRFLTLHYNDILSLLILLRETVSSAIDEDEAADNSFGKIIGALINKSSVTSVSDSADAPVIETSELLRKIHSNVSSIIKSKRPDISNIKLRPITDKGGFFIYLSDNKKRFGVSFKPKEKAGKIAFGIDLEMQVARPSRLVGKEWEEMYGEKIVRDSLQKFDSVIMPLLKNAYYFEGRTYPELGPNYIFPSFTAEQAYRCEKHWQDNHLSNLVSYWINLKNISQFDDKIMDTIANVIIGAYDYHSGLLEWK
ncbi:MAG: KAP family NTPase [Muribaculaceae bacterium]|nr:KAP family NTPase [Muribaculaceae bacterium]